MCKYTKLIHITSSLFLVSHCLTKLMIRRSRIIEFLVLFCSINLIMHEAAADSTIDISVDANDYTTGSTYNLNVSIENGTPAIVVDVYIALVDPTGGLMFLTLNPDGTFTLVPAMAADPDGWAPLVENLDIPQGFSVKDFPLLQYQFSGSEPLGQYTWYAVFVNPGTRDFVSDIGITGFTFSGGDGGGQPLFIVANQSMGGSLCANDMVVVNGQTLIAYGGSPSSGYTWTLSSRSTYPAGTTVDSITGVFHGSGGTLVVGTHNFSMTVSDGSQSASGDFTFTVDDQSAGICGAAVFQQSSLATINLPNAESGFAYGASLFVTLGDGFLGATRPLSWSLGDGESLPGGLQIDSSKGVIRGVPFSSQSGLYEFRITVKDVNGTVAVCPTISGFCPKYIINMP